MVNLPGNLRYALRHSPTLDIHLEVGDDGLTTAVVTTDAGEFSRVGAEPVDTLQQALAGIGA